MCGSLILLIFVANTFYAVLRIHFCRNLHTFFGKIVLAQTLLVSKNYLFPCLPRADTRLLWSGVLVGAVCSVQCAVYTCQEEAQGPLYVMMEFEI